MEGNSIVMRYFGGKARLAPEIVKYFPAHDVYVDAYGGAGGVLLCKPRAFKDVYNDLDGEMVNLFTVIRDRCEELVRATYLTPVSAMDFQIASIRTQDQIEQARRTLYRMAMSFSTTAIQGVARTGWRPRALKASSHINWYNMPDEVIQMMERLRGVVIENDFALSVIDRYDSKKTLFYIDPPYVLDTRVQKSSYKYEMDEAQHENLLATLVAAKGMVIVSGYHHKLYDNMLAKWKIVEIEDKADSLEKRVEVLWIKPHTSA